MSMKLQLQVGKRYVNRQGAISGPLTDSGEDTELDLIGYLIIRRIAKGGAL